MTIYRVTCQTAHYDLRHEYEAVSLMHYLAHLTGALVSMKLVIE